jgi:hypothetical protein
MLVAKLCAHCGKGFMADSRALARGWGECCSKSCASFKREGNPPKSKSNPLVSSSEFKRTKFPEFLTICLKNQIEEFYFVYEETPQEIAIMEYNIYPESTHRLLCEMGMESLFSSHPRKFSMTHDPHNREVVIETFLNIIQKSSEIGYTCTRIPY